MSAQLRRRRRAGFADTMKEPSAHDTMLEIAATYSGWLTKKHRG
jgi:hypothetical protein